MIDLLLFTSSAFVAAFVLIIKARNKYMSLAEERYAIRILDDCGGDMFSNNPRMQRRIELLEDIIVNDNISRTTKISNGTIVRIYNQIRYMKLCIRTNESEEKIKKRFEEISSRLNEL